MRPVMTARRIRIQYFAGLRDKRGLPAEDLETTALNPLDLYRELQARYGFGLPVERLSVAINGTFATWDTALKDNDEVVFIPPVAGG